MSGKEHKSFKGSFRILDIVIVLVFLAIAAFSLNLFRLDLFRTIDLQNVKPVGTVVVKKNIVQRRHADRFLWDSLSNESYVYIGDIIRIADISEATLHIEDNKIDLGENTMVRITRAADGESLQINLRGGTLSLAAGSAGGVVININGKQVKAEPEAIISASSGADGRVSLQVNSGSAQFIGEGAGREIVSGMAVTMDAAGNELPLKSAVVTSPFPNARYLKDTDEPFAVSFSWNRINLEPSQNLRLDIGMDRNFSRISRTENDLYNRAQVLLDSGVWFWRLSFEEEVLAFGSLTIADGSGLELESPALNSLIRYYDELPVINFQWKGAEEAVSYIIEVSNNQDFAPVRIQANSSAAFLRQSGLEDGSWYWRVRPVFPPVYEGTASYSRPSLFRIEKTDVPLGETSWTQWLSSLSDGELPSGVSAQTETESNAPVSNLSLVNLLSPADGTGIPGLTALRERTIFQWETGVEITSSRFIISSNPNPLQGRPAQVIANPGRTVRVDRLGEGTWYWTVEVQTADGLTVSAQRPRRVVVRPIPLLPAPGGMSPERNTVFGYDYFKSNRNISFRWNAVQGANAYIFTLYQQMPSGRRQIEVSTDSRLSHTFTGLSQLDRGTFVWQVEAVNRRGSTVEQRGRAGEGVFVIDFQSPLPVQIEDTGILYGN
jgi:hypothetical protein